MAIDSSIFEHEPLTSKINDQLKYYYFLTESLLVMPSGKLLRLTNEMLRLLKALEYVPLIVLPQSNAEVDGEHTAH
jgi:hypothetical protein